MTDNKLRAADWALFVLITAAVFLHRYYVLNHDPLLAWPVTDAIAHPDRYSPDDLLVTAGVAGNFVLYKLLGLLPFDNYPLRDFLLWFPIYVLTMAAWWKVFVELGASRLIANLSVLMLAFSDSKLAINWAHVAWHVFISATSVHFIQVFALVWFLRGRRSLALGVTAATGILHPASALSLGLVYSAIISYQALVARAWRSTIPMGVFALVYAPIALMIALNSQIVLKPPPGYFGIFEQYQPHVYLSDHFRLGYVYTAIALLFIYQHYSRAELRHRQELFLFIGATLVLSVVWLANVYLEGNLQFIHTYFTMRLFALVHPLIVFLIVNAAASLYTASPSRGGRVMAVLAAITPLFFSPPIAAAILVVWLAQVRGYPYWLHLLVGFVVLYGGYVFVNEGGVLQFALRYIENEGPGQVSNEFNWIQITILLAAVIVMVRTRVPSPSPVGPADGARPLLLIVLCAVAFLAGRTIYWRLEGGGFQLSRVFEFRADRYWGVRNDDGDYADLVDWVKQSPYRLYAIPPYDDRFMTFRYFSGHGVYVFHRDIGQLMYAPTFYVEAVDRLIGLGGSDPRFPKAIMYGLWPVTNGTYEQNCEAVLASQKYDAVIFQKKRLKRLAKSPACFSATPVYENKGYVVYRTGRAAAN